MWPLRFLRMAAKWKKEFWRGSAWGNFIGSVSNSRCHLFGWFGILYISCPPPSPTFLPTSEQFFDVPAWLLEDDAMPVNKSTVPLRSTCVVSTALAQQGSIVHRMDKAPPPPTMPKHSLETAWTYSPGVIVILRDSSPLQPVAWLPVCVGFRHKWNHKSR